MSLRFLSLFSGIEAASVAWKPLGWTCVGVAEIDPFGCSALAAHYPEVPNLGDISRVTEQQIAALGRIDVLVFGSPCQDLSVAGKRKGLDGERSGLFFTAMRIVQWAREHCGLRWAVWENVPGAFSSNDGRDFAAVVAELAGIDDVPVPPQGWGTEGCAAGEAGLVEWSTLDAQWFGVAQRRRRVFAVADFGDWANRPPVLLERDSVRGDSAPQRCEGQDAAAAAGDGVAFGDRERELVLVTNAEGSTGLPFLTVSNLSKTVNNQTPLLAFAFKASHFTRGKDGAPSHVTPPLSADADKGDQDTLVCAPIAVDLRNSALAADGPTMTLQSGGIGAGRGMCINAIPHLIDPRWCDWRVRRLTPLECERLQGYPDNYTRIVIGGKPAADTPRYRALGNTMCVNVMRWIGQGIDFAHRF